MPFDPNQPFTVNGFDPTQPYEVVKPKTGRSVVDVVKDTAIDAAKGVVGLGESAVGLADIVTGNLAGKGLTYLGYDPQGTNAILSDQYSDQRKEANAKVADADGFLGTLEALVDNPSVAFGSIVESAPMSLGGVAAARGVAVRMLGTALAENGIAAGSAAAKNFAVKFFETPVVQASLVRAGAVAEGAQSAGSIQEQARQGGREWEDSVLPAVAAGAGTAAIGIGSSKIPGLRDAEATVATAGLTSRKAGTGFVPAVKEIGKEMFKEGVAEEMPQSAQEKAFTNVAMGQPWEQGVGSDAAQGLVVGAAQGGGMAAVSEAVNAVQPAQVIPIDKTKPSNLGVIAENISEADREQAEKEAVTESLSRMDGTIDGIPARVAGQPVDFSVMKELPEGAFTANKGKSFVSESALRTHARIKGVDLAGRDIVKFGGGLIAVPKPEVEAEGTVDESRQPLPASSTPEAEDGVGDFPADWGTDPAGAGQDAGADDFFPGGKNEEEALIAPHIPIDKVESDYGHAVAEVVRAARKKKEPISLGAAIELASSAARTVEDTRQLVKRERKDHGLSDNMVMTLAYLRGQETPVPMADIEGRPGKGKAMAGLFEKGLVRLRDDGTVEVVAAGEKPFGQEKAPEDPAPYSETEERKAFSGVAGMATDTDGNRLVDTKVEAQAAVRQSRENAIMARFGQKDLPGLSLTDTTNNGGKTDAEETDNNRVKEGNECTDLPNAERQEVIDNPDSAAHGQVVNTAPSKPQADAGNYKKAHKKLDGLSISIENPAGSVRSGMGKDGKSWETEMKADYGYIKGTKGYDKDHLDIFIAPGYQGGAKDVFVVNQHQEDGKGKFDEHKAVLGAKSEADALKIYESNYEKGWKGGVSVTRMPVDEFKGWAESAEPTRGPVTRDHTQAAEDLRQQTAQDRQNERKTYTGVWLKAEMAKMKSRPQDERKEFPGVSKEIQTAEPFSEKDARRTFAGNAGPGMVEPGPETAEAKASPGVGVRAPLDGHEGYSYVIHHAVGESNKAKGKYRATITKDKHDGMAFPIYGYANSTAQALENAISEKDDELRQNAIGGKIDAAKVRLRAAKNEAVRALLPESKAKADAKVKDIESEIRNLRQQVFSKDAQPAETADSDKSDGKAAEKPEKVEAKEGNGKALSTEEQIKALSDEDITNLFDEVDRERAAAKATPSPAGPPKRLAMDRKNQETQSDTARPLKKSRLPKPKTVKAKTAGAIVKEGGIAANTAVKEAMAGLSKLFGDPNTLRSGPAFDEETYRQAKPHFVTAWNGVKDLGYSVKELVNHFYDSWGDTIRPYLERFVRDLNAGNLETEDLDTYDGESQRKTAKKDKKHNVKHDVNHSDLSSIMVSYEAKGPDSDKTITVNEPADKALAAADADIEHLYLLRECLGA